MMTHSKRIEPKPEPELSTRKSELLQTKLSSYTKEDLIRLVDETPAWPDYMESKMRGRPFKAQVDYFKLPVYPRYNQWQVQAPVLVAGTMMQLVDDGGWVGAGNDEYWYETGVNVGTGNIVTAGSDMMIPNYNAYAVYAGSTPSHFVTTFDGIGAGCGVLKAFLPDWDYFWLIREKDATVMWTVFNDNWYGDNQVDEVYIGVYIRSARTFFKHLLSEKA